MKNLLVLLALMAACLITLLMGTRLGEEVGRQGPLVAWVTVLLAMLGPGGSVLLGSTFRRPLLVVSALLLYPFYFGLLCGGLVLVIPRAMYSLGLSGGLNILASFIVSIGTWGVQGLLLGWAMARTAGRAVARPGFKGSVLMLLADYLPWALSATTCIAVILFARTWLLSLPMAISAAVFVVAGVAGSYVGNLVVVGLMRACGTEPPGYLRDLLHEVVERTGIVLDDVIYVREGVFGAEVMHVRMALRGPVLVASEEMFRSLTAEERLAVLVHEAAHVAHRHLRRGLVVGCAVAFVTVLVMMSISAAVFGKGVWVGVHAFVALSTVGVALRNFLSRRWEREADRFAAHVVGRDAIAAALRKTAASSADAIWGTHPPLEERLRLIEGEGV
jgi:Zn-dependent protease with chaperone function